MLCQKSADLLKGENHEKKSYVFCGYNPNVPDVILNFRMYRKEFRN
jgi:hypothetical protein